MVIVVESLLLGLLLDSNNYYEKLGGLVLDFFTQESPSFTRFIDSLSSRELVEMWNLVLVLELIEGFFRLVWEYFLGFFSNMTLLKIFLYSNLALKVELS